MYIYIYIYTGLCRRCRRGSRRRPRRRRSRPQELLSFVDRGVTRYEGVTRYILRHEEAYTGARRSGAWTSRNSVGSLAREAKEYRFSSSFPSSGYLAPASIFSFRACANQPRSIRSATPKIPVRYVTPSPRNLPILHIAIINYVLRTNTAELSR